MHADSHVLCVPMFKSADSRVTRPLRLLQIALTAAFTSFMKSFRADTERKCLCLCWGISPSWMFGVTDTYCTQWWRPSKHKTSMDTGDSQKQMMLLGSVAINLSWGSLVCFFFLSERVVTQAESACTLLNTLTPYSLAWFTFSPFSFFLPPFERDCAIHHVTV